MKIIKCKLCGGNLRVLESLGSGGMILQTENVANGTGHSADCPAAYSHIINVDKYVAMSKKDYLEYLRKEIIDRVESAEIDIESIDVLLCLEDE